jgi:hypothetical protein
VHLTASVIVPRHGDGLPAVSPLARVGPKFASDFRHRKAASRGRPPTVRQALFRPHFRHFLVSLFLRRGIGFLRCALPAFVFGAACLASSEKWGPLCGPCFGSASFTSHMRKSNFEAPVLTTQSRISHCSVARFQAVSGGASVPRQCVPAVEKQAPNEGRAKRRHTLGGRSLEAGKCCRKPAPKWVPASQSTLGFAVGRAPTRRPRTHAKARSSAHPHGSSGLASSRGSAGEFPAGVATLSRWK